jgi:hypothetical protein
MPYQRIKCNLRGGEITDSEIKTEIKHAKMKYFKKTDCMLIVVNINASHQSIGELLRFIIDSVN